VDPERLQRVLFNLIQNAIRHTPADGSVTVLSPTGTRLRFSLPKA
jgi:signal transduction histidine kinase